MDDACVIANGQRVATGIPCSIEQFLLAQKLRPRSVVVEHNGQAVAPSEFGRRQLAGATGWRSSRSSPEADG